MSNNIVRISTTELNDLVIFFITSVMMTVVVSGSILTAIKALDIKDKPESYPFNILDALKSFLHT